MLSAIILQCLRVREVPTVNSNEESSNILHSIDNIDAKTLIRALSKMGLGLSPLKPKATRTIRSGKVTMVERSASSEDDSASDSEKEGDDKEAKDKGEKLKGKGSKMKGINTGKSIDLNVLKQLYATHSSPLMPTHHTEGSHRNVSLISNQE